MGLRLAVSTAVLGLLFSLVPGARAGAADSTVTISQGVDADTLDPLKTQVTPTNNVLIQLFDTLLIHDPNGKLVPSLATSWKQVAPTVWEFKLRKDVKFSNGDPLTSADVKFAVEKIKEPAYKSQQTTFVNAVERVEAPDPFTVRYITKKPVALVPGQPFNVRIVSAKYWQAHGDAYMADHPIGSGPYVLRKWDKDSAIEMDANPNYWGGKPPIDHVVWKPIPENASRVAALKTGATDLITNVPVQYALSIEGGRNTRMASVRSIRVLFIAFNTQRPGPQANKLVRQAINYAVDVPLIIKNVLGGRGYELGGPLPSTFSGYDPKVPAYTHDVAKAKALLAQAGYPDGKGLDIVIHAPQGRYNKDKEIAEAVAGQLSGMGIKSTVRTQEWTAYFGQVSQKALEPMYMLGWGNNTFDADFTLAPLFSSEGRFATWTRPDTDKLIEDARYELNPVKRQQMYSRVLTAIHDDAPWLFLFQYEDLYATSRRLQWQPRGDEQIFVMDMRLR